MSNKTIPPSCTSCRHFDHYECKRKKALDPVHGLYVSSSKGCVYERSHKFPIDILFGTCGVRGRFWEKK